MPGPERHKQSMRHKFDEFLRDKITAGEEELAKQQLNLKHSLGLGSKPNVVPPGEASITGAPRLVELGWHPVAGMSGKWFAEKTWFGKEITKEIGNYPDPTQHWAILVGDYVHQLWMDEDFHVIYINEVIDRKEWHTFEVGKTRFNDEALRQAAEMTIHNMRAQRPAYNLITNNCQNFAEKLLDSIQIGAHREFATAFAVYQSATGKGEIKDLFARHPDDEENPTLEEQTAPTPNNPHGLNAAQYGQQLMDRYTKKLDFHPESVLHAFHLKRES